MCRQNETTIRLTGGELFRVARRRAGLTQVQVASLFGRNQNAVSRWEAGDDDVDARLWREVGLVYPSQLRPWEEATVLRERIGLSVNQARQLLTQDNGCLRRRESGERAISHVWILRLERGADSPDNVIAYIETLRGQLSSGAR